MHTLSPRRKAYDRTLRTLLYICAGITCALLVFIIGYIFYRGAGQRQLGAPLLRDQLHQ